MTADRERLERGRRMMETLRPGMAEKVDRRFNGPSGDFGELVTGMLFGEIWQRPGLDLRTKEVAVLSALIASRLTYEFSVHVPIAVNLGISRREILDLINHLALYIGFPAAAEAMQVVRDVLGNDDEDPAADADTQSEESPGGSK